MQGNSKVLCFIEILWGFPFYLVNPFAMLYMRAYGITDIQIGIIVSIGILAKVVIGSFVGILTDKFGRKKLTAIADFVGWGITALVLFFANNFASFVFAYILSSFQQISLISHSSLLVEDEKGINVINVYTVLTISAQIGVIFAPISGIFVEKYGIIPVVKVIYLIFTASMIAKALITYFKCVETKIGENNIEKYKNTSIFSMFLKQRFILKEIFKNKEILKVLFLMIIMSISTIMTNNFFNIYINENLFLTEKTLSFLPLITSVATIFFMVAIQHRIKTIKKPMFIGFVIYILAQIILVVSPTKNIFLIFIKSILEAFGSSMILPRKNTLKSIFIEREKRATTLALMATIVLIFTAPFSIIGGIISSFDRRLPFVFNILLYTLGFITVIIIEKNPEKKLETV